MEPQGQPEVLFCDLCNTSVPLQDFETGRAVRHEGKAIGACCLGALGVGAVTSAAAQKQGPAATTGSPMPPAAHAPARGSGEARLLPLGIAMLGALAAATLFLDFRIDQVDSRGQLRSEELGQSLKAQAEVVQASSLALDGVTRKADLDDLLRRVGAIEQNGTATAGEVRALGEGHARAMKALDELQTGLANLAGSRPDYGPMLAELRQQMRQQGIALAELLARPRAADASATPAPATPAPAVPDGLPAELAHQVGRLGDADAATRFEAVDELLRSKNAAVLEHLLPMTTDPDTFVRRLVVEGLKDFVRPAVVDALITALLDPEEIVRDTAWRSLKELTGQKLPFDAAGNRDALRRAQQKWQEWWDKNRDSFGS